MPVRITSQLKQHAEAHTVDFIFFVKLDHDPTIGEKLGSGQFFIAGIHFACQPNPTWACLCDIKYKILYYRIYKDKSK